MPDSPRNRLIPVLEEVTEIRPGVWQACCPAHVDSRPSLRVTEVDDGKLLIHCFAGCSADGVTSAVGLKLSDLFPHDDVIHSWRDRRTRRKDYRTIVENARGATTLVAVYAALIRNHWDVIAPILHLDNEDRDVFLGATEDLRELLRD
jgi:hypothetical protein